MESLGAWFKEITPGGVGIWTAVGLILVALIRQGPINRKLANEREGNLLKERALEMGRMRRRIAELEAEQRVDRHQLANLEQILEGFLEFVEAYPERAQHWASRARAKLQEQKMERATEKAGILAAKVAGSDTTEDGEVTP